MYENVYVQMHVYINGCSCGGSGLIARHTAWTKSSVPTIGINYPTPSVPLG